MDRWHRLTWQLSQAGYFWMTTSALGGSEVALERPSSKSLSVSEDRYEAAVIGHLKTGYFALCLQPPVNLAFSFGFLGKNQFAKFAHNGTF